MRLSEGNSSVLHDLERDERGVGALTFLFLQD
jgi:hypothetical protein